MKNTHFDETQSEKANNNDSSSTTSRFSGDLNAFYQSENNESEPETNECADLNILNQSLMEILNRYNKLLETKIRLVNENQLLVNENFKRKEMNERHLISQNIRDEAHR